MHIELKTLFIVYVVYSLLGIVVMTFLWTQNRKRFPEITLWLADYILQFIALSLITLRGKIPDLLSIITANSIIILGTVILYSGLEQYAGKKSKQLHNYIMLAVFTFIHSFFTYIQPSLACRNINFSLALIYICVQGAWLMLIRIQQDLKSAARTTGIILLLFCAINLVRVIDSILHRYNSQLFLSGNLDALVILADETLFIALTFALFLLIGRKLQAALEKELVWHRQAEDDLRTSEEKFSKAFQSSSYAIAITRLDDGMFIEVNDSFVSITGYSREELTTMSSINLNLWVDREERERMISMLRNDSAVIGQEFLFRKKNGEILTGLFSTQIIQLREGQCMLSSIDDITERKRIEEDLRSNRRFLSELVEHSATLICVKDPDGRYELVNRKFEEVTGFSRTEALGRTDEELFPGDTGKCFRKNDLDVLETGNAIEVEEIIDDERGRRFFLSIKFPLKDDEGRVKGICGMITEITSRKNAEEQIRHLANHDILTDLPTMRLARDRLSSALNTAHRYKNKTAVMFIDLDGFKCVNDTLGHKAGDEVLKEISLRMLSCVRSTDTVARVGGDEFMIIAADLHSRDDAAIIAQKVISLVAQPVNIDGRQARVSASIGIVIYPDRDEDMDQLIKDADEAMYRVKNSGKNSYLFSDNSLN